MAETKRKSATKKKVAVEAAIPAETRGTRKAREGIVASNTMDKTVVVKIERRIPHALYGKVVKRTGKFKAHDEIGCDVGDRVEIVETRPMSREKRWRVSRILERVK
jgi:small subunit ribosomal protein S17